MNKKERIDAFIAEVRKTCIENHRLDHIWISGSSTEVYPIMVWEHTIDIQLKGEKA